MTKSKMHKALADATGDPKKSFEFMEALEEYERQRQSAQEKLFTQIHKDNEKFIEIVDRRLTLMSDELSLQRKELSFLRWAILRGTTFLSVLVAIVGIMFAVITIWFS